MIINVYYATSQNIEENNKLEVYLRKNLSFGFDFVLQHFHFQPQIHFECEHELQENMFKFEIPSINSSQEIEVYDGRFVFSEVAATHIYSNSIKGYWVIGKKKPSKLVDYYLSFSPTELLQILFKEFLKNSIGVFVDSRKILYLGLRKRLKDEIKESQVLDLKEIDHQNKYGLLKKMCRLLEHIVFCTYQLETHLTSENINNKLRFVELLYDKSCSFNCDLFEKNRSIQKVEIGFSKYNVVLIWISKLAELVLNEYKNVLEYDSLHFLERCCNLGQKSYLNDLKISETKKNYFAMQKLKNLILAGNTINLKNEFRRDLEAYFKCHLDQIRKTVEELDGRFDQMGLSLLQKDYKNIKRSFTDVRYWFRWSEANLIQCKKDVSDLMELYSKSLTGYIQLMLVEKAIAKIYKDVFELALFVNHKSRKWREVFFVCSVKLNEKEMEDLEKIVIFHETLTCGKVLLLWNQLLH